MLNEIWVLLGLDSSRDNKVRGMLCRLCLLDPEVTATDVALLLLSYDFQRLASTHQLRRRLLTAGWQRHEQLQVFNLKMQNVLEVSTDKPRTKHCVFFEFETS